MAVAVRLLGRPAIERDGAPLGAPRARKTWALLAFLVLSERPPARTQAAALLHPEADDPLGALRWTLADLRRTLAPAGATVGGDPLTLVLAPATAVDVLAVLTGSPGSDAHVPHELLEGLSFPSSPVLESWLAVERSYVAGAARALAHDEALARLAAGDLGRATALAKELAAGEPLDLQAQELLIRCLARQGRRAEAERRVTECEALIERELGVTPGPELRAAARDGGGAPPGEAAGDAEVALGQLEAGRAAIDAGAVEPGIDILRRACAEAAAAGDEPLQARALAALGAALVHAVRGRDEEGALRLHEALRIAERAGGRATGALACRELGYIDTQAGRNPAAGRWLARATQLSRDGDELCAVLGVRGMALSDRAYYGAALELLEESVARAHACGRPRQAAWSLSLVGRAHLLRGDAAAAAAALDASLALVASERWTAFRPWPEALRGEAALAGGRPEDVAEAAERAFRLACRLGDPCWEAMSARLAGSLARHVGDAATARRRFADALARATRVSDAYVWVVGHVLDGAAAAAVDAGAIAEAQALVDRLAALAERCGLRELVVRAHAHRARLGDPAALEAARLLAADIDNPALAALVEPVLA